MYKFQSSIYSWRIDQGLLCLVSFCGMYHARAFYEFSENQTDKRKLRDTFIFAWPRKSIILPDGNMSNKCSTNFVPKVSFLTCPWERVCCTTWLTWQHKTQLKCKCKISNFRLLIRLMRLMSVAWQACCHHLSVNWDETQASPQFKLVNTNFNAFVHCSSELNWILKKKWKKKLNCNKSKFTWLKESLNKFRDKKVRRNFGAKVRWPVGPKHI